MVGSTWLSVKCIDGRRCQTCESYYAGDGRLHLAQREENVSSRDVLAVVGSTWLSGKVCKL